MKRHRHILPLKAVRALALHAQGLDQLPGTEPTPTPDVIFDTVSQIGCVQIDTLQRVQRSQYLTLWSRLGSYDTADFDRLIYGPSERRLFEYWLHAACIIPLDEYRYRMTKMDYYSNGSRTWNTEWLSVPENQQILEEVRRRIQSEGPLRTIDFKSGEPRRGSWWDWKPAKRALEILYDRGELMIADRVNFQRVYDLRDRVLPSGTNRQVPSAEETERYLVERAVRVFGICMPMQTAEYAYLKRNKIRPVLETLIKEGVLVEVEAELFDGTTATHVVHRDQLHLVEQAADGAISAQRTTFLSPFDNLLWPKNRDKQVWNFHQILEAYKPAPQREWGYFCLPILHRDRLVGRFDPKLERKQGLLRLEALYLEPGIEPEEQLVNDVAGAMRDFMRFHEATDLEIVRSEPQNFGEKLLAAL